MNTTAYTQRPPDEPFAVRFPVAARLLSVSVPTIKSWCAQGHLRAVSVSPAKQSAKLVTMSSIRALVEGGASNTEAK